MTDPRDTGVAVYAPELVDIITDTDLDNYHGARRLLMSQIPRAVAAGHSGKKIAARLSGVFGQDAVINYVTAIRTAETVGKLLARFGLHNDVGVFATGPDSPVGAWVALGADPGQVEAGYYAALPAAIRSVLESALLTIDPACDPLLLDGGRVPVSRIQPVKV